jgi:hypothetical protein
VPGDLAHGIVWQYDRLRWRPAGQCRCWRQSGNGKSKRQGSPKERLQLDNTSEESAFASKQDTGKPLLSHRSNTGAIPGQYRGRSPCPGHSKPAATAVGLEEPISIDLKQGSIKVADFVHLFRVKWRCVDWGQGGEAVGGAWTRAVGKEGRRTLVFEQEGMARGRFRVAGWASPRVWEGGFGNWKRGRLRHTTCRVKRHGGHTSNSAFSGVSGFKGFKP